VVAGYPHHALDAELDCVKVFENVPAMITSGAIPMAVAVFKDDDDVVHLTGPGGVAYSVGVN
jgi:hypothetical protein